MAKINVENAEITVIRQNEDDFISLTDMARSQLQEHIIFRWLSLKSTIEYLGEWEMLYNPDFNCTEFGATCKGISAVKSRRAKTAWLERKTGTCKNQLPHPYRCNQAEPYSA